MSAIHWRGVLLGGLFLAAQATTVAAQERELLTLDAALARAGIVDSADEPPDNPRLIGPRAEADAARALVDQARLRPNPEIAFEAENIAGSGAFSGLQATEYTLSLSQRLELGGKRGARVRAAQAEARVATLSGALSVAQLGRSVRERYVEAVAAAARLELARDIVERNRELARIAGVLVDVGRFVPKRHLRRRSRSLKRPWLPTVRRGMRWPRFGARQHLLRTCLRCSPRSNHRRRCSRHLRPYAFRSPVPNARPRMPRSPGNAL